MDYETFSKNIIGNESLVFKTQVITDEPSTFHDHTFYELFYVISGSVKHYFNGAVETLNTGDLYFMKPGDIHMFISNNSTHSHRDIMISPDLWKNIADFLHFDLVNTLLPTQQKISVSLKTIESLEILFSQFHNYPNDNIVENPFVYIITIEIIKKFLLLSTHPHSDNPPAWLIQLTNQLSQPGIFTSNKIDLFEKSHYSYEYICRVFKTYMHETPTNYINNNRLSYAASLLCSTDKSIQSICYECGFLSIAYFNKLFKSKFGTTPSRFRKSPSNIELY